jgi:hypothetical protein
MNCVGGRYRRQATDTRVFGPLSHFLYPIGYKREGRRRAGRIGGGGILLMTKGPAISAETIFNATTAAGADLPPTTGFHSLASSKCPAPRNLAGSR